MKPLSLPRRVILTLCVAMLMAQTAVVTSPVEQYREMVNVLADAHMEGRGPGTRGLDLARDYLVEQFREAGLQPAFHQRQSYTQAFDILLAPTVEHLELAIADQPADPERDVTAVGISASGTFDAPVVFVGYGVVSGQRRYDSYAPLDGEALRGKVALALRFEPMDGEGQSQWNSAPGRWSAEASLVSKAKWAAERGAVALLIVNPPSVQGVGMVRTARTASGETAAIPMLQVDADWLQRAAPSLDLAALQREADRQPVSKALPLQARGSVQLARPIVTADNVAGFIPGVGQLAEQVVVIGAHYDHLGYGEFGSLYRGDEPMIHHGADDNASGTAAITLASRDLAQRLQRDPSPRRTLMFVAFSGEERGLLGSVHLMDHLTDAGLTTEQIVAMINLDMVGRMKDNVLNVMGSGSGEGFGELVQRAADGLDLSLRTQEVAPGGSDHVAFHIKGIPAVHLYSGSHGDYHRPSDTADKINAEGGVRISRFTQRLAMLLATQPQTLAFVPQQAFAHGGPGGPEGGAMLGVMPDYASLDGEDGAIITGVLPGSPAQEAGLQSGDVIVAWDGKKVGNVRVLTDMLSQTKGGQTVELTVRRGEQEVKLKATLRAR